MDILLDSADLTAIGHALEYYPIKGVTTNPSMLASLHQMEVVNHLCSIRALIGETRDLHVQLPAGDAPNMGKESLRCSREHDT